MKKPSSVPEAYAKFTAARSELSSTIQDYDQITKGGGDNIRRYLGTVGTSSSIFGLKAVLKILQDSADDIGAFVDASEDFDRALVSADSSAYSSMFVEFSAAKGTKEDYYAKVSDSEGNTVRYLFAPRRRRYSTTSILTRRFAHRTSP